MYTFLVWVISNETPRLNVTMRRKRRDSRRERKSHIIRIYLKIFIKNNEYPWNVQNSSHFFVLTSFFIRWSVGGANGGSGMRSQNNFNCNSTTRATATTKMEKFTWSLALKSLLAYVPKRSCVIFANGKHIWYTSLQAWIRAQFLCKKFAKK